MALKVASHERSRWDAMSSDEKARYEDMGKYLESSYGTSEATLADVDSALAVGA